jgi:predicted DNA-binding antitoxin AbrB/MazE fold protein
LGVDPTTLHRVEENAGGDTRRGIMKNMRRVSALYEQGRLKPDRPLPLEEGERVVIIVLRPSDQKRWDPSRLAGRGEEDLALAEQGLADWATDEALDWC